MLRVTIEIWPGGDKARARAIAIASVANISELAEVSDYAVSVTEGENPIVAPHLGRDGGMYFSTTAEARCGRLSQRLQPGRQKTPAKGRRSPA